MAGSLLICHQIKVSDEDLKRITGGSYLSPADIVAGGKDDDSSSELRRQLAESMRRAAKAKDETLRAQRISAAVAVGSLLVAAGGLLLSWRSTSGGR